MNILLASTYDTRGGAAIAAGRLHRGLQSIGCSSQRLVQTKLGDGDFVLAPQTNLASCIANSRVTFDHFPLKSYSRPHKTPFSPQWLPDRILGQISKIDPDIINLHWINSGFIRIETIGKIKKPIVWTLHDMWAFTGGCHYTNGCDRYMDSCGQCPQLGSSKKNDLSHNIWKRKLKAWKGCDITVVTPSTWLKKCAQSSTLFKDLRVEVIPNGIDTQVFRPAAKRFAREMLGLPEEKRIILFGAIKATSDERKGFHFLQEALRLLGQSNREEMELAIFGASSSDISEEFGLISHYLGSFSDELPLRLIYSAADVFVVPSVEDNLPNTIVEALSCGTPCVAFDIGGMSDLINHQHNGILVEPYKTEKLAKGIAWVLDDNERNQILSENAREKALQNLTCQLQAQRYLSLFKDILPVKS